MIDYITAVSLITDSDSRHLHIAHRNILALTNMLKQCATESKLFVSAPASVFIKFRLRPRVELETCT
jgi:hypothetical protein